MASSTKVHQRYVENLNMRNILDNGGFEIWQRGTSFTNSGPTCDRWILEKGTGATLTLTRESTQVLNGNYSVKIDKTVLGTASTSFYQKVEDYKSYRGKTLTLSISAKTSVSNTLRIVLSDSVGASYSSFHTGSGSWETLTATLTIDASNINVAGVVTLAGDGSIGIFYIDNAMLVVGDKPVDYISTSPSEDWDRCTRFYLSTDANSAERLLFMGDCTAGQTYGLTMGFPVVMSGISTPTYTLVDISRSGFNAVPSASVNKAGIEVYAVCNTTGASRYYTTGYTIEVTV